MSARSRSLLFMADPVDERVAEAINLVVSKRHGDDRWPLEVQYPGAMPVDIDDGEGRPSRWNTLRALRVLDWYSAGGPAREEIQHYSA